MNIGVSTSCLYPMETERALEQIAELGVRTVEIFINSPSEVEPEQLRHLVALKKHYGLTVTSVHPYSSGFEPFLFFTNYRRRFYDAMKLYESFYNAANELGAGMVVLHGDRIEGLLPAETYYDRYGELFLHAQRHGIVLAQENVSRCRSRSSTFIEAMRQYLGENVRFVLDLKQAVRAGEDAFVMLEAMGKNLIHLHLSDFLPQQDCLPPGTGEFDFKRLKNRLEALHYQGSGVVELYRQNYKNPDDLYRSYLFLKSIL